MESIAALVPVLGCALMMAPMMWLIMRMGRRTASGSTPAVQEARAAQASELAELRAETARLRAARATREPGAGVGG